MATIEQEQDERKRLHETLVKLGKITPQSLSRREELGQPLSFESGVPYFERTLKLGAWLEFLTFAFLAFQENLSEGTAQEWMRTPMSIFAAVQK